VATLDFQSALARKTRPLFVLFFNCPFGDRSIISRDYP